MGKSYNQLSIEERTLSQTQLSIGMKPAEIAEGLKRSASTLSPELRRKDWVRPKTQRSRGRPMVSGSYRAAATHLRVHACRIKPRIEKRLRSGTALWHHVVDCLKAGYSPEQVAGTLATVHPAAPSLQVPHETVYTAIHAMLRGALRTEVIGWLRLGHAKRRPRERDADRRGKIPDMVRIHDRPPEVAERVVPVHWEDDLIKGAYDRSAVGTLVERATLFTVLAQLDNASAASVVKGFGQVLHRIVAQRLSLTYDQGREMAAHQKLTEDTGMKGYFADPHSPWQRGIHENTNGLLQQYLSERSDLSGFTKKELDAIAWKLNTRPRKSLGFKCPAQLFSPDAFDLKQHHAALFALGT